MASSIPCSKEGCTQEGSKRCSRCKFSYYCSPECQRADWSAGHKKTCAKMRDALGGNDVTPEELKRFSETGDMPRSFRNAWIGACPKCGDECSCAGGDELRALWRKRNGREIFMGIVTGGANGSLKGMLKLNDPEGPLDGPGHVMELDEFMTECSYYDDYSGRVKPRKVAIMDYVTNAPKTAEDILYSVESHDLAGVVDFVDKPDDFTDSQDSSFDAKFPFADEGPPQVRAGDFVKIMVSGACIDGLTRDFDRTSGPHPASGKRIKERCWFHVISVTSFGMVTALSIKHEENVSRLTKPETGPLAFPVTAVIGMRRGKNWD